MATGKLTPSPPPSSLLPSPLHYVLSSSLCPLLFFRSPTLHLLFWPSSLWRALQDAAGTAAFPVWLLTAAPSPPPSDQPLQTSTFSQANRMEAGWEEEGHCLPTHTHTHTHTHRLRQSDNLARWVSAPSQHTANAFSHYYYQRSTWRFASLSLCFPICKLGVMRIPIS